MLLLKIMLGAFILTTLLFIICAMILSGKIDKNEI